MGGCLADTSAQGVAVIVGKRAEEKTGPRHAGIPIEFETLR